MADLTFREQAAIAAMREEMRDSLGDVRGMPDGYHADIAREAWLFADAMDAERIKRTAMSEPAKAEAPEPTLTAEQVMELGRRVGREQADAELSKLRVVADAAARLGRFELEVDRRPLNVFAADDRKGLTIALASALEQLDRDWRTKEGGR